MTTAQSTKSTKSKALPQDNPQLAALAHFSIIPILGPFSPAIPLLIWLLERNKPDKSELVEFHAKQAFFFQLAVYVITAALGLIVTILSIIVIGLLFIPFLILFPIVAIIYGIYGGVKVWTGQDFRYIFIADFIEV